MSDPTPVIQVQDISKKFELGLIGAADLRSTLTNGVRSIFGGKQSSKEEFWALKGISFDVFEGDVVGIIGKNGAGKSTLLKVISRITLPTTGEVTLRGRVASLLEVGTGFHPELTGRENIFLNGSILGMKRSEIKEKFDEIVAFSGVEKFIDTPVKRYSSGMYVRLAFAVAAHLDPEILIIDEVLSVGDFEFQRKCLGKMNSIAKQGRTVLFVSHNMGAVKMLCGRSILLEGGQISSMGETTAIVDKYLGIDHSAVQTRWDHAVHEQPENEYFHLNSLALLDTDLNPLNRALHIDKDERIYVQIEGVIKKEDPRLSFGIVLKNNDNIVILDSKHTDLIQQDKFPLSTGRISLRVPLDITTLNQGEYFVEYNFGIWGIQMIHRPETPVARVTFELIGLRGDPMHHIRRRDTVLAPYIKWQNINL